MAKRWTKQDIDKLAGKGITIYDPHLVTNTVVIDFVGIKEEKPKSKGLQWLEQNLSFWSMGNGLHMVPEYQFLTDRKWRFDFCWPSIKVALEFEGGIFQANSGHKTAKHYTKDTQKYNAAAIAGWRVLRYTAINYRDSIMDLDNILKSGKPAVHAAGKE